MKNTNVQHIAQTLFNGATTMHSKKHQDPASESTKGDKLSRRDFFRNSIAASSALGLAGLSFNSESFAQQSEDIFLLPNGDKPELESYWQKIRDQFLIEDGLVFMNSGTKGPSPKNVYKSHANALENVNSDIPEIGSHYFSTDFGRALMRDTRNKLAVFLGAKPNEIAFTNNTTEGMIFGTMGISLKKGDQIIYTNHDHPFACNPILHRAAKDDLDVKVIDLSAPSLHPPKNLDVLVKEFEKAITNRTKLISFCHMNYTDGCIMPVKEICEIARSKGIITLVDGAQPPGMMKLDLHDLGADMYAGACHKWMLAGMYTGFLYIREDFLDRVKPMIYTGPAYGYTMNGPESDIAKKNRLENYPGAAMYEQRGSLNLLSRISINAALDFLNHIGQDEIEARDRYLANYLNRKLRTIDGLKVYTSEDPRLSCGIVSFTIKDISPSKINSELWEKHNIWIRSVSQQGIDWNVNRASLHLMVTARDVNLLVGAIKELAAS